jgi:hypothetical protein
MRLRCAGGSVTIVGEPPATRAEVPLLGEQSSVFGRPDSGHGATATATRPASIDLEETACYTCTGWHTCLVFLSDSGVRVPLCETCLHDIVPRAIDAD